MASIDTNTGNGNAKKGQPTKLNLRVDFTPMVDMNMLLITFFMFCTTLSTPQVMDIVMPAKVNEPIQDPPQTIATRTVTLLLGENGKLFYYWGIPDYSDKATLKETALEGGLRNILFEKNQHITAQANELKELKRSKKISDEDFKAGMSELKKSKDNLTVIVKPTDRSNYSSLVRTLDEMQICNIGRYAIVDVAEGDQFLLDNMNNDYLAQAAR